MSRIAPPRTTPPASWDDEVDVLVVGFGAAGAAAGLEAASEGADVLIVDRFEGGGSTAMSGGVVYLGGGTPLQVGAGVTDDPEAMTAYLVAEAGDDAEPERLRRFSEASPDHFAWLERNGLIFSSAGEPTKTSYPDDDCSLYYSGNELCFPFREQAAPAARGHRVLGPGLTGARLFDGLRAATARSSARIRHRSQAIGLVQDDEGGVIGASLLELPQAWPIRWTHRGLYLLATYAGMLRRPLGRPFRALLSGFERLLGRTRFVRARGGVVLCSGGFIFDEERLREHAPEFRSGMPLGTASDDGTGIALGESVGGRVDRLDRIAAWRFFSPPEAFVQGLLVDPQGRRFCNEELYGARLGERIASDAGGRAWLVIDGVLWKRALRQIGAQRRALFQRGIGLVNLLWNRRKASSLEELAGRCSMKPETLRETVDATARAARDGTADRFGKSASSVAELSTPPFYAIRCDIDSLVFPTPCMTLGGLATEIGTARVQRADGTPVPGLYAAGRCAAGVASWFYVSGLSIADGIDAGRTAGRHAARAGSPATRA